jgi:hypothetical protein
VCTIFCTKGLAAEHPMLFAEPQVADSGHRVVGKRRRGVGSLVVGNRQQSINFLRVEAGQNEIEVDSVEFLQFPPRAQSRGQTRMKICG